MNTSKVLGLVMILALVASSYASADKSLWQCTGANLEGLGVSAEQNGTFPAGVSWDCFPGGGVCDRNVQATLSQSPNDHGATVFEGTDFKLVINTDKQAADGSYSGHITATGQGAADLGGGMALDEDVSCTSSN